MKEIELTEVERRTISALQSKLVEIKVRSEASISAYEGALREVFSAIIQTAGSGNGHYQMNAAGTALVELSAPPAPPAETNRRDSATEQEN